MRLKRVGPAKAGPTKELESNKRLSSSRRSYLTVGGTNQLCHPDCNTLDGIRTRDYP